MKKNRFIKEYGTRLSFALAALALLLFIPAGLSTATALRVFLIVCIAMLLVCGGILLYLGGHYNTGREVHYFLYDRQQKKSLSKEELNEEAFIKGIDLYLADFDTTPLSLFEEFPKPLRIRLEEEEQFRLLICYRMLQSLCQCPQGDILPVFASADTRALTYLCRSLRACGDGELAEYIYDLKQNLDKEAGRIPLFFKKNERRFLSRAMRYLEQNFDSFYVNTTRFF